MGALDWVQAQYVADGEADPDQFNAEQVDNLNNAPRGIVYFGQGVHAQSIAGTMTDLTNMSVTFTAVAGRLYRIMAFCLFGGLTEGVACYFVIRKGASTVIAEAELRGPHSSNPDRSSGTPFAVDEPGAGSVTYKASAQKSGGTVETVGTSNWFLVEDIGPA